jgi:hypothetical protein
MWIVRAIALFAITNLALNSMLGAVIEMRGASDYIKPFHSWNMLLTSIVSVAILEIIFGLIPLARRFPWFMQWLAFVHIVMLVAFLALPFADRIAVQRERAQGPPMSGDMGYGWYYWDDSGMGGNPVTGFYLLFFFYQPISLGSFLFGSAAVIGLASHVQRNNQGEQAVHGNTH